MSDFSRQVGGAKNLKLSQYFIGMAIGGSLSNMYKNRKIFKYFRQKIIIFPK